MPSDIISDTKQKMIKGVEHYKEELSTVRTGKANPSLVEGVTVDYYGSPTRVKDLACITSPEPRLLVVQPWDMNAVDVIAAGISKSELGIVPQIDGKIIRIVIPELSEERRKELDKIVKQMAEENKIALRNIRRDSKDAIKKQKKDGEITEDDLHRLEESIQKETDKAVKQIDDLLAEKEKELKEI